MQFGENGSACCSRLAHMDESTLRVMAEDGFAATTKTEIKLVYITWIKIQPDRL